MPLMVISVKRPFIASCFCLKAPRVWLLRLLKRPINRDRELHWFGICCTLFLLKLPQKEAFVWGRKRFGDLYPFRKIQAAFSTDLSSFFFCFWEQLLSENGKDNRFGHFRNISNSISGVFSDLLDILSVPLVSWWLVLTNPGVPDSVLTLKVN